MTYLDLAVASVFLILNAVFSIWLQLGLARKLIISALRMVVQLLLIGLVLKAVFAASSAPVTLLIAVIMVMFAGREIRARQERRLAGIWGFSLGGAAMLFAGSIITVFGLTLQIDATPWWMPQYSLPLFGMILGNTMTGVSLGLDTLHTGLYRERNAVEAQLLLGRTRWQATAPVTRRALRSGFTPIINAMAATGVVALPGMMTGQILSGIDPQNAVQYQLLIMFLIAGATGLGVMAAIFASLWRLTDRRHRLRLDRLARPRDDA
nr:iron export ABC transporter permease subunit FetB [Roseibium sp. RKSG952]